MLEFSPGDANPVWFEFAPADTVGFDELLHRLRETPEWRFVDREVELRLRKAADSGTSGPP